MHQIEDYRQCLNGCIVCVYIWTWTWK